MESTDIHLWFTCPDRVRDPLLLQAYRDLLSPEERSRLEAFLIEPRRHEHLVTRALVRTVLSRYGASPPADWRFVQNAHGRPELDPPGPVRFNLSNSPGLVGCAVARCEVGLDLEPHGRAEQIHRLADRIFSDAERRALDALPAGARADRALSLWTLKEAYLKARGTGISAPLQEITFAPEGPARISMALGPSLRDDPARWRLHLLDHAGHRVALAAQVQAQAQVRLQLRAFDAMPLVDRSDEEVAVEERAL